MHEARTNRQPRDRQSKAHVRHVLARAARGAERGGGGMGSAATSLVAAVSEVHDVALGVYSHPICPVSFCPCADSWFVFMRRLCEKISDFYPFLAVSAVVWAFNLGRKGDNRRTRREMGIDRYVLLGSSVPALVRAGFFASSPPPQPPR